MPLFEELIGKTIASIRWGKVPSEYGEDDCVYLVFTDGTEHGFVLPTDD